jgi:hypothetical protein
MAALKKQGKAPVLPELQLMRELRQLQEAVPADRQDIRPAARFPSDVARALLATRPRILQFSGHGDAVLSGPCAGALAFDLDGGGLNLPDPADFILLLQKHRFVAFWSHFFFMVFRLSYSKPPTPLLFFKSAIIAVCIPQWLQDASPGREDR